MDCEFVKSYSGKDLLARVSLINFKGEVVYDTLVLPEEPICDFIPHITGLSQEMLHGAPKYSEVNQHVINLIRDAVVIGHTLICDLEKFTSKEEVLISYIDVSEYKDYMKDSFRKSKLKDLAAKHFNAKIQESVHSSIIDSRAALALY